MKKKLIVLLCLLSTVLLTIAGNVAAYNAAFTHNNYMSEATPTIDGQYTYGEDWAASLVEPFGTNGFFRDEWTMSPSVYYCLIIETADNTNNPGDYWEVTFDSTTAGEETPPNGGTAPQTDDYKIRVTGHGETATVQWYKGSGTGWNPIETPGAALFAYAQSLSSSPKIADPHYILELRIEKTSNALGTVVMGYNWASYYAYNDANEGGYGLQSWPPAPASPDVPNSWGYIPYVMSANPSPDVPEGIGIGAVIILSSAAVIAGAVLLRKHQKPDFSPTVTSI